MLEADLQPRGAIFTNNSEEPTMKDYVLEWNRLGYGNVVEAFRKTCSLEKLKYIVESSLLSEKRQQALMKLINKRGKELCGL